eukprot:COSAG01_NODE_3278_length_6314_cov_2.240386_3_plen_123_part_00
MAQIYNVVKEADPYHAVIGALNCGDTWAFSDVPSYHQGQANLSETMIPFGVQPHTQLSLDYLMVENYGLPLHNHIGSGSPGQQQPFQGEPIARDGSLRDGNPFTVLVRVLSLAHWLTSYSSC